VIIVYLGFDIAMQFRGESLQGFSFTTPVPAPLPVKPFLVGLRESDLVYVVRAVVNGVAKVSSTVVRRNNKFHLGVMFNPNSHVLDL
jgi:hypothetical protein